MKKTRKRNRGERGVRRLNTEISEELLRTVSGGMPNSGTGRTYQEEVTIGMNPNSAAGKAAVTNAATRLKEAQKPSNMWKALGFGVASVVSVAAGPVAAAAERIGASAAAVGIRAGGMAAKGVDRANTASKVSGKGK
jgi:hypothetical protein